MNKLAWTDTVLLLKVGDTPVSAPVYVIVVVILLVGWHAMVGRADSIDVNLRRKK